MNARKYAKRTPHAAVSTLSPLIQRMQTNSTANLTPASRDFTVLSGEKSQAQLLAKTLQRAATESGSPMNESLRGSLQQRFGHNFGGIRVHNGQHSADAADMLGARAYTLGTDIYLGRETQRLACRELNHLLVHEAIHSRQQGGRRVFPHAGLNVSTPADASEHEARRLAHSFAADNSRPSPSPSLALRDNIGTVIPGQKIVNTVPPQIQRDLTGKKTVNDGDFVLDLKTKSNPGGSSGLEGTIKFTPSGTAPDSPTIRLVQIVRTEDLTTSKDYVWTGGEANRNKMMTTATKEIKGGYFVDHLAAKGGPRAAKGDKSVSPFYIDYTPNARKAGLAKDGSKAGKTVTAASLYDFPQSDSNMRFSFETAAKSTAGPHTGYTYATLTWGFTVSDAAKGKVDNEKADAHRSPSKTLGAAVKAFDEFYKNPGSSTAP